MAVIEAHIACSCSLDRPATERGNLVIDAHAFGKEGVIEVFDSTGQRLHSERVSSLKALQQLELSRVKQEGLYLVMLRVDGQAPRTARLMIGR